MKWEITLIKELEFLNGSYLVYFWDTRMRVLNFRKKRLTHLTDGPGRKKYFQWLQKSSFNKLKGLHLFNKLSFVHGTSQAFDDFYSTYKGRRFRVFKGEFK